MLDFISITRLVLSIALPWLMGLVWLYALLGRTGRWHPAQILGAGYLSGIFATTVIIRIQFAFGQVPGFYSTSALVALMALFGCLVIWRSNFPPREKYNSHVAGYEAAICIAVMVLVIIWRYSTIFQEVALRPLYPWDAWMNWAPKAIVWEHYQQMMPFVDAQTWLAADLPTSLHTIRAASYPITVPLVQFWSMQALGTSDHTLIYLHWPILAVSLGLALYGYLRLADVPAIGATMGSYMLLGLPYINVHTALAGYADLWMAAAIGLCAF
jgi:hypothetical protein